MKGASAPAEGSPASFTQNANAPAWAPIATSSQARAFAFLAVLGAWSCFLPLGMKYLSLLLCTLLAAGLILRALQTAGSTETTAARDMSLRAMLLWPPFLLPLLLWLMLVLSAAWSHAPVADVMSHLWHYGRVLCMPLIALACPPQVARLALRHFIVATAAVGALTVLEHFHALPDSAWLRDALSSTVGALGNQRIATSLLVALGAALALAECADGRQSALRRSAWLVAAVVAAAGLVLQDRRTGMATLPVLLMVLAVARQPHWLRRTALIVAVAALLALTWQASSGVRARFAEGWTELRAYPPTGEVASSWGMRLRMVDVSLDMVKDKPLLGHGVGSWLMEWQTRARGGRLLEEQLTPHNEYLLIAVQLGGAGTALWLALLAAHLQWGWRSRHRGEALLLVWVALAWSALFNVVIRDAKFALPLLLLGALAMAAHRSDEGKTPE